MTAPDQQVQAAITLQKGHHHVGLSSSDFSTTQRQLRAIKDRFAPEDTFSERQTDPQALSPETRKADSQFASCAASQRIVNGLAHA